MDHFSAVRPATHLDVVGRAAWFNPPWALSGHALELVERAWRADPWNTHAVGVVPVWRGRWWWNRFIARKSAPFRVIGFFAEGTDGLFLKTGSDAFRVDGRPPEPAGPAPFELVMVEIGGGSQQGGAEAEEEQEEEIAGAAAGRGKRRKRKRRA